MADIFLLKKPHITEKATDLNRAGKYVFIVKPSATKPEIEKAVKEHYGVEAVRVNIINIPARTKHYRTARGRKPGHKKAVVTLKEGQKIELR